MTIASVLRSILPHPPANTEWYKRNAYTPHRNSSVGFLDWFGASHDDEGQERRIKTERQ
jgi:hypothetical protein